MPAPILPRISVSPTSDSPALPDNSTQFRQKLKTLAEAYFLCVDEKTGEVGKTHLFRFLFEKFKGLLGYSDHTNTRYIGFKTIQLLQKNAPLLADDDIDTKLVQAVARNTGLIPQKKERNLNLAIQGVSLSILRPQGSLSKHRDSDSQVLAAYSRQYATELETFSEDVAKVVMTFASTLSPKEIPKTVLASAASKWSHDDVHALDGLQAYQVLLKNKDQMHYPAAAAAAKAALASQKPELRKPALEIYLVLVNEKWGAGYEEAWMAAKQCLDTADAELAVKLQKAFRDPEKLELFKILTQKGQAYDEAEEAAVEGFLHPTSGRERDKALELFEVLFAKGKGFGKGEEAIRRAAVSENIFTRQAAFKLALLVAQNKGHEAAKEAVNTAVALAEMAFLLNENWVAVKDAEAIYSALGIKSPS